LNLPQHYVTVFNAQRSNDKNAWSPYYDKTFIFKTYPIKEYDNVGMFNILVSYWTLNIPLAKIKEPIRTYRRKENLEPFLSDKITYFVLDIDKVKTKEHKLKILEYFSKYKCILGESKSYDDKINFNMKGILFIEPIEIKDAKSAISNLNFDLKEWCDIDEAVVRIASLNAPIGKNKVLLNKDKVLFKCEFETRINKVQDGYVDIEKKQTKIDINNITGATLEEFCINIYKSMGFEPMKANDNGSIQFKHPTEKKSVGGYFWFSNSPYTMHHFNSTRSINIYDAVRKSPTGKELLNVGLEYDNELQHFNTATKIINTHEKYLTVKGKDENGNLFNRLDEIKMFLEQRDGLYSIKSPMGTAKSTIIHEIIKESHYLDMQVLVITNRISVAQDFAKKYNMKVYNKDQYNYGDSIIVQFDSLWKYDIAKFDIVIMDEFISLMCHSRNNLGNSSLNIAKFFGAFNKKLVIADAFLTGYENFLLEHKTENVWMLNNQWRDKTTLFSYSDKNYFFQSMLHSAKTGKITVSGTSLNFLNSAKALFEKHGKKCILLTATTPESTKELIYELFEKEDHDKWDIFLFSPSLTVGVSNLNNVHTHFHYDTSMSTDVISSIQMIKRTRKATSIHMYIADRINYVKTTFDSVRDEYLGNIGKNIDQNFLFDVDNYGTQKLSRIGKNAIKIDTFKNILEFNHKKAMLWMMKYHFFNDVREVSEHFEGNILSRYSKDIKDNKQIQQEHNIQDFLELSPHEKINILMDNTNSADTIMKTLVEIDDNIKLETPTKVREQMLQIATKDKTFIIKCRNYKVMIDFTNGFTNIQDIKTKISNAMINNEDIMFLNMLLRHGQTPVKQYYIGTPEPQLLNMLKEAGYKKGTKEEIVSSSIKDLDLMCESEKEEYLNQTQKVLRIDPKIKEFYGYIK